MSYVIKRRGAPTQTIAAEYECPVHGRFKADVDRDEKGDAPEIIVCMQRRDPDEPDADEPCGLPAEWRISAPLGTVRVSEVVRGKSDPPPPNALDTRALADGMPLNEWKKQQAKKRKERIRKKVRAWRA